MISFNETVIEHCSLPGISSSSGDDGERGQWCGCWLWMTMKITPC